MKRIKNILVITPDYPYDGEPICTFVQNLCAEFARKGLFVSVLAPQSLTSAIIHHKKLRPKIWYEFVNGNQITIYQPYTLTFSYKYWKLYNYMTRLGTLHFLRKSAIIPDVCYCHFWRSAYFVVPYIKENNIPMFVATGEGALQNITTKLKSPEYLEITKYLNGVISVSTNNKIISNEIGLLNESDCIVAPNAIDKSVFCYKERKNLRKKYGIAQDDFIVAFVGTFNNRKGSLRLSKAIDRLDNVKSFFIGGEGESALEDPICDGIIFKGSLPHNVIPDYLNMADIFVLPTLNEGCANAIIEAMACGLPIISSNLPFNHDVLNKTNSILIDPMNIDEIAEAINKLKNNQSFRKKLSDGALKTAERLTIDHRAQKILEFMEKHI